MKLLSLVFSGGKEFPWSRKKSVKQLELLKRICVSGVSCTLPSTSCLCALLQQNLEVAMVIATTAVIHHELAANSPPCPRFSVALVQSDGHKVIFFPLLPHHSKKSFHFLSQGSL